MKLHIKNVHARPNRAAKRLSAFTPCSKPVKRSKILSGIQSNKYDESILLTDDDMNNTAGVTIEEEVEPKKTFGGDEDVEMNSLPSCDLCNFDTESVVELQEHMRIAFISKTTLQCLCAMSANLTLKMEQLNKAMF